MMNRPTLFATSLAIITTRMASAQLVINEIMQNPSKVDDRVGEWFELFNPTQNYVDINGWTIKDDGTNSDVIIDNNGPLLIGPGNYLVLGNNADLATNGGVTLDYEYDGSRIQLNNRPDEIVLLDNLLVEVDRVNWDGESEGVFPNTKGAAIALLHPTEDNNDGSNWCEASTPYGDGDYGTPGAANDCKRLVINEIMRKPSKVKDSVGEWFELFNPTRMEFDVNGWTIRDDGSNSHVIINNDGPLLIVPGGYLVLGNNADVNTNGGVNLDYEYDGSELVLSNRPDELVLLDEYLVEIDRVNWDGGSESTFPDPNGAAHALRDPDLDNNVGGNWCAASTVYGDGDKGTPGAPNDCTAPALDPMANLVINEIMRNPKIVQDRVGEWFELFNPTGSEVDIDGWTIKDDGFNSHLIDNGGPLLIAPGGYLVLGNNADASTNGGVNLNYNYGNRIQLNNGEDELVLLDRNLVEVDRVNWDGGKDGSFPRKNGAAMALRDPALDNTISSNWCDASTAYGDGDQGTPGAANDCRTLLPTTRSGTGTVKLVINEIMVNPSEVSDRDGEWFELFNPNDIDVDIDGWTIKDEGFNSHEIRNDGPLVIPPGGYLVLGNNDDFATNGGVNLDYDFGNRFSLNNGEDEIVLLAGDVEVDRVTWSGGVNNIFSAFPNPKGAAWALRSPLLDNNDGSNWCQATTEYGDGDKGTPGAANDCPYEALVINEIMRNPSKVNDRVGEWFELYNPTQTEFDINGWTIRDDGFNRHVIINNGGPLLIAPGGYLVLGNNADVATNGGVALDYEYDGGEIQLNNLPDELVLQDALLVEIDRVNWDVATFPNPNGAAQALRNPALDNNVGSSWCEASTSYGDGDKGTPGAANDCAAGRRMAGTKTRGIRGFL